MSSGKSVTHWLKQLQAGDPAAAQQLWDRYFRRLVGLARHKLRGQDQLGADEEDVALSAFKSFWQRAQAGKFPQLANRDSLWRLLFVITIRKAYKLLRKEARKQRPGRKEPSKSRLDQPELTGEDSFPEPIKGEEPFGELKGKWLEEFRRLVENLDDPVLCLITLWKLLGATNAQIASWLDCAERTVDRKLVIIRDVLKKELEP